MSRCSTGAPGVNDMALLALLRTHHDREPSGGVLHRQPERRGGARPVAGRPSLTTGHPLIRLLATIASLSPQPTNELDP
jgi:hypothetical protein